MPRSSKKRARLLTTEMDSDVSSLSALPAADTKPSKKSYPFPREILADIVACAALPSSRRWKDDWKATLKNLREVSRDCREFVDWVMEYRLVINVDRKESDFVVNLHFQDQSDYLTIGTRKGTVKSQLSDSFWPDFEIVCAPFLHLKCSEIDCTLYEPSMEHDLLIILSCFPENARKNLSSICIRQNNSIGTVTTKNPEAWLATPIFAQALEKFKSVCFEFLISGKEAVPFMLHLVRTSRSVSLTIGDDLMPDLMKEMETNCSCNVYATVERINNDTATEETVFSQLALLAENWRNSKNLHSNYVKISNETAMPNMIKTDEAAHFPGFICYLWRCLGMYTATMKLMMFPKVMCVSFYDVPYNVKKRSSNVTLTAKARMAFCWESVEMGTEYKLYLLETGETISIKRADWLKNKIYRGIHKYCNATEQTNFLDLEHFSTFAIVLSVFLASF